MSRLNTVGRCVVSGCNNTKDDETDFSINEIPFYGDSRPKDIKRRRKWITFVNLTRKNLSASTEKNKSSDDFLGAFCARRFHTQVFF